MKIKQIFDEIAAESSLNKKVEILEKYKDNSVLRRVLYMANSSKIKFFLKQIPEYKPADITAAESLDWALDGIHLIANREYTGNEAIAWLKSMLSSVGADDAYILERIIEKDCRINMGSSLINKVFPNLIEETPYMGAKSFSEDLAKKIVAEGAAISQLKMDGRYCNAIIRSGDIQLESRQGEPTILDGAAFVKELAKFEDIVLNGELTMDGISRYESNGIVASLISIGKKKMMGEDVTKEIEKFEKKHMPYQKALDSIRFTVWDSITVDEYANAKSTMNYDTRLNRTSCMITQYSCEMISLVETRRVKTYEEAMAHFQEMLAKGYEGTILKSGKGTWKDGKPNWQVKMKLEMDVDLRIIGFNYGTGKNANVISSVDAESSDGLVVTSPTGINEKMMKHITENQDKLMGTILEVKCSGLSHDSTGKYSLLHPVFKSLRDDKDTCDTLESIKEIEAMAKGLVKV